MKVYNVYNLRNIKLYLLWKRLQGQNFVTENFWSWSNSLRKLSGVIWTILAQNMPNLAYLRTLMEYKLWKSLVSGNHWTVKSRNLVGNNNS